MKFLFFADFHFNCKPQSGGSSVNFAKPVAGDPASELVRLLKERYKNEKISFIIFLGDYVIGKDSGEKKSEAFDRIKKFVENIEKDCACIFEESSDLKNRIIFIDGNHDVSRENANHDEFAIKFGDYLTPFTKPSGSGLREKGAPVFDFKELDIRIACISTTQNAGSHFINSKLDEIKNLIEPLQEQNPSNYYKIQKLIEEQQCVDIGTITEATISQFKECDNTPRKINIVSSHHPLIQMQHATAAHFETVNGPIFFDTARAKGFTFFISGHLHEFYCADIFSRGKDSDLPSATIISVPRFINTDSGEQRFIDIDINNSDYICRLLTVDKIRDRIEEKDVATNGHYESLHKQDEHTLVDYEIQKLIEDNIIIENASTDRIQSASYDCALGLYYKKYDDEKNSWFEDATQLQVGENGNGPAKIRLDPGEKILIYTHEEFHIPDDMMLQASPRASWIRKGINVDLSFFVEPGFSGAFCFPISNNNKCAMEISAQESIMSIIFRKLSNSAKRGWSERNPHSVKKREEKLDE